MYYDSRLINCSFRSTPSEALIQYGHIYDGGNIFKVTATADKASASAYWNYTWFPSAVKCKLKLYNYTGSDKAIYFVFLAAPSASAISSQNTVYMKIDRTNVTFQFGLTGFDKISNQVSVISFPHGQRLFEDEIDFFFGCDEYIPDRSGKVRPDYYFAINDTKYTRTGTGDRSNWTIDQIPIFKFTGSGSTNYGYYLTGGMTAAALTVFVYGSSPLGFMSSYPEGVEQCFMKPKDVFDLFPAYACFHIYTGSSIHNHTRDSLESSSDRAIGGYLSSSGFRAFDHQSKPLFFPNKNAALNSWKYNQLGRESFSLVTAGEFTNTTANAVGVITFRIFEGTVTPGPEYSGSQLRLRLDLNSKKGTLKLWVSNCDPDDLWIKEESAPIFWHPYCMNRFQFSIHYDHAAGTVTVRSKVASSSAMVTTDLLGADHDLITLTGIRWKVRTNCFYAWGDNSDEYKSLDPDLCKCRLYDFFCSGDTSRFTSMKIVFSLTGDINDEVESISMLSHEPTNIFILHTLDVDSFSPEKRALYTDNELRLFSQTTINLSYDTSAIKLEAKGNGLYSLTALKAGTHRILASYTSANTSLISSYSIEFQVFAKLIPRLSVTFEETPYFTNTGSEGIYSSAIRAGNDFEFSFISNIDRIPDKINKSDDLVFSSPVIEELENGFYSYTYTVSSLSLSAYYDVEFVYDEKDENEEGHCFFGIEVIDNRETTYLKIFRDANLTSEVSVINVALPTKDQTIIDQTTVYAASTILLAPDSKFSSNSVALYRGVYFEVVKDGTKYFVYPYTITPISEKSLLIWSLYYEETENRTAALATVRITVSAPSVRAATNTGERSALIALSKDHHSWLTSLMIASDGTVLLEEPISMSSDLKLATISFANELTTMRGGA